MSTERQILTSIHGRRLGLDHDGGLVLNRNDGTQVTVDVGWEDLRFPAQGINPAGAASAPSVSTTLADYPGTLEFAGNADNVIVGVAQLPHAWLAGSGIRPHIHWAKATSSADAVVWNFYYRILGNPGDAPGAWSSAQTVSGTIGTHTAADQMLLSYFPEIDMTGLIESAMLNWRLDRLGNTDAYAGVARLFELDFHYIAHKSGTVNEIPS